MSESAVPEHHSSGCAHAVLALIITFAYIGSMLTYYDSTQTLPAAAGLVATVSAWVMVFSGQQLLHRFSMLVCLVSCLTVLIWLFLPHA